jgi:hypothetical protein
MDGIISVSKTSRMTFEKCPWHLHATKVLGLSDTDTSAASIGREVHDWRARILSGSIDLETALAEITNSEVVDLLCSAIAKAIYDVKDKNVEQHYDNGIVHGYIDLSGRLSKTRLYVEDLKTGWSEKYDHVFERDVYSVLHWDKEADEKTEDLLFVRFYCRSGNHHEFLYDREEIETARDRIQAAVDEMVASEPIPIPGAHCLNWFGRPCAFHGTECPLAKDVPALIDNTIPDTMQTVGKAFMDIYRGLELSEITPEIASNALMGVHQIEAAAKIVEAALKNYADTNGPITIGNDQYGWKEIRDYEVNKEFALEAMFAVMPIEDIAKVVNLSKTAIDKKISRRRYGPLRQSLLDLGMTLGDGVKRRFGKL